MRINRPREATMTPANRERIAGAFWEQAGSRPPPPRNLAEVAPRICPVWVRFEPDLTRERIRDWFSRRGLVLPLEPGGVRPLHGCVVAYRGRAAIFVESQLSEPERRVILAHELGHFLGEYLVPRERIVRRLGSSVLPVLDGDRPATFAEETAGWLAGVRVGVAVHLLDRCYDPDAHDRSERNASDLGLELLAGRAEVLADAGPDPAAILETLTGKFGIPPAWAVGYARRLAAEAARREPLSKRWRL